MKLFLIVILNFLFSNILAQDVICQKIASHMENHLRIPPIYEENFIEANLEFNFRNSDRENKSNLTYFKSSSYTAYESVLNEFFINYLDTNNVDCDCNFIVSFNFPYVNREIVKNSDQILLDKNRNMILYFVKIDPKNFIHRYLDSLQNIKINYLDGKVTKNDLSNIAVNSNYFGIRSLRKSKDFLTIRIWKVLNGLPKNVANRWVYQFGLNKKKKWYLKSITPNNSILKKTKCDFTKFKTEILPRLFIIPERKLNPYGRYSSEYYCIEIHQKDKYKLLEFYDPKYFLKTYNSWVDEEFLRLFDLIEKVANQ